MGLVSASESFIGVTWGFERYKVPEPVVTANLIASTYIRNVRFLEMDELREAEMAKRNVSLMLDCCKGFVVKNMASDNQATTYEIMKDNIAPLAPHIDTFIVGSLILGSDDPYKASSSIVPAMEAMKKTLDDAKISNVKVSTVLSDAVLTTEDPPSNARFRPEFAAVINPLLKFLRLHKTPFYMANYPYYTLQKNPTPENLEFCLFEKNAGRVDPGTGLKYWNMFDWKIDAMRSALNSYEYNDLEIVVAETGWPTFGDDNEVDASKETSRKYNANLVHHLRTMTGTPMMPKQPISAYIHSLFDEDRKKGGKVSEKWFGIINAEDLTWNYDLRLQQGRSDI